VNDKGVIESRRVVLGPFRDGVLYEVKEGLKEDDRVVLNADTVEMTGGFGGNFGGGPGGGFQGGPGGFQGGAPRSALMQVGQTVQPKLVDAAPAQSKVEPAPDKKP